MYSVVDLQRRSFREYDREPVLRDRYPQDEGQGVIRPCRRHQFAGDGQSLHAAPGGKAARAAMFCRRLVDAEVVGVWRCADRTRCHVPATANDRRAAVRRGGGVRVMIEIS